MRFSARVKTCTPLAITYRMRLHDYAPRPAHLKWLLDSDPALRWQVMRDLTGEAPNAIAAERSRVATEGWGAQLLAFQSPAGNWGGSPISANLRFTNGMVHRLNPPAAGVEEVNKEASPSQEIEELT